VGGIAESPSLPLDAAGTTGRHHTLEFVIAGVGALVLVAVGGLIVRRRLPD
jgi:hypothetical protein